MTALPLETIRHAVDPERLAATALSLIEVPSPTRSAGAVADRLAQILADDGFTVKRPEADWPQAPAVAVRYQGANPGRTLQFDGHLDTVHLPFVPPRRENGLLYGSGSSDMKGGIAAFVEALRVLRETGALTHGSLLLTAHDHHEGPWGDKRQLYALIRQGYTGDAVLLPEYLADRLPLAGRGMAIFEIEISRHGEPVHEVLRPDGTPDVISTGAELILRLRQLGQNLAAHTAPHAGSDSLFVGLVQSGEIFNQSPIACTVKGTRRWVTPGTAAQVKDQFESLLAELAAATGTHISTNFEIQGDAFRIAADDPLVAAFQSAYQGLAGAPLETGGKPFVDDGNLFAELAGIPAITHGPAATGAHTLDESVPLDELVRIAQVYALTAIGYCAS
ncbi:MAG: M20/M25/M40 family metallo-hydrolase [Candidatus Latescibacteria bacterium]|nr:M20/M25/M40 family metallo-hydrolase [Candidatus Latescibacterota bacterium]